MVGVRMSANWRVMLSEMGHRIEKRLVRRSGWDIPDDSDGGLSAAYGLEFGAGVMQMVLREIHTGNQFKLTGGYFEVGIGLGEIEKFRNIMKKQGWMTPGPPEPTKLKPGVGSDATKLPGGSLTELIMNPIDHRGSLTLTEIKQSCWCYVAIAAELGIGGGDFGLMFLVEPSWWDPAFGLLEAVGLILLLIKDSVAVTPYWGLSFGTGVGAKIAIRVIQHVSMSGPFK